MKDFKEWFSDYLRYFLLLLAVVLLFGIIFITVKVYQNYDSPTTGDSIEIVTETNRITEAGETEAEKMTEAQTESSSETDGETEALPQGGQTEAGTALTGESDFTGQAVAGGQDGQTMAETQSETETEPPAEAPTEREPEPVYRTMTGACNFRRGPGYEYEVMAVYPAGTTVEFLGIVEGWCEVRIDGVIGYMGQRFFE